MRSAGMISGLFRTTFRAFGGAMASRMQGNADRKGLGKERGILSSPTFGIALIFALGILLCSTNFGYAGTEFCSDYKKHPDDTIAIIDGNDPYVKANLPSSSFGIDMNCEFRNFLPPEWPNGLTPTLNFKTSDKSQIYLIVFDSVYYTGNMACSNIAHKLWAVNSYGFKTSCQNIMIPAETIDKDAPAATANIGDPFTYTLTLPSMNFPAGAPSPNDLGNITVQDDLTATGADLTLLGLNAYYKGSGTPVPITHLPGSTDKFLHFTLPNIDAGQQVVIEMTVVLDDTANNYPGKQFTNIAKWWFSRWIDLNENGFQEDNEFFDPLPGEWGISRTMTIVAPRLVVSKTSPATALNVTDAAVYTIDAQNVGGGNAWDVEISDQLPLGMCVTDPTAALSARIVQADGVTLVRSLDPGTHYTLSPNPYTGGCFFSLTLTDAGGPVGPQQRLIVTYESQLDPEFTDDGARLTNVAGATRWFSASSTHAGRQAFLRDLTDGTPTILDHEDSHTVTAAMHGYYFEKIVRNLTSLANPATTAAPGDTLRYRLRVFNVDQEINAISIVDALNPAYFDLTSFSDFHGHAGPDYVVSHSFDTITGVLEIFGAPHLDVNPRGELVIEFSITLREGLANGTPVINQAELYAAGFYAKSDDPYVNGVADPDVDGDEDPTVVVIQIPGPLLKVNTQATATIGEQFVYLITVPATPTNMPLYDVQILDRIPPNLRLVSAEVLTGGTWTLSHRVSNDDPEVYIIEDLVTGIDIPANGRARILITVELLNSDINRGSVRFANSATYSYNRANGVDSTRLAGSGNTTADMLVVEPLLTVGKTASFVSPAGKPSADPATVGDVLEYRLTIRNNGTSTAFDINVIDTLPPNVMFVEGSATASINGIEVEFIDEPDRPFGTTLIWGRQNGDGSLDVPVGQTLVLTYRVTVVDASSVNSFTNRVYVDWTSLDHDYPIDIEDNPFPGRERTGEGCGTTGITLPNRYCVGPVAHTVHTVDNTSIAKSVYADSYLEEPPSPGDPILRVGDTVTYDVTLHLQEYTTRNVAVEDTLPAGLALQSFVIIADSNLSYVPGTRPTAGATGSLRWEFGDIINMPDGDATNDTLTIRYVARAVAAWPAEGVPHDASLLLDNTARLSYAGGDPAIHPDRLTSTARIDLRQPVMQAISKVDRGTGRTGIGTQSDPYQVNISAEVMNFRLSSCNDGLAPAYKVLIADALPPQLNVASITTPVVHINGSIATAGTGYAYSAPAARGGTLTFLLHTPVDSGQCVTIDYNIGFHTDFGPGQLWSNAASLSQYESLPADGRLYTATDVARVWMTNPLVVEPLVKLLISATEATIGELVNYQITVPAVPMNSALDNVLVSDTLHDALDYVNATVTLNGVPLPISTTQSGQALTWIIGVIPAGQQAVITLTTRVANNEQANAGTSFTNTASYTYTDIPSASVTDGSSAPLAIVEPSVAIGKTPANVTQPGLAPVVGDVLRYTVTLTASGGAVGDNFSSAFDAGLVDTMSLGQAYVSGTARINGLAAEPSSTGDGQNTPQTLAWTGGIDIPEGTSAVITYDVRVLATVVAGQTLTNSATAQWTGLDGASAFERDGSGTPAYNDYFTGPAATSLVVADNNRLSKGIVADTYVEAPSTASDKMARIGDTATYRLTLHLGEGTTRGVTVLDLLPAGMAYDSLLSITPASGSSTFTYNVVSQPTAGATGTLIWDLGDVVNVPSNDGTQVDALIIEYRAKVLPDAGIAQVPTTSMINTATLSYLDVSGNPVVDSTRLVASDTLTLLQPVMSPISKIGNGAGNTAETALNVNVASDTVQFRLQTCNTDGLAPAYDLQLTDVLASQLDETSIATPVLTVGGSVLIAGTHYTYTPPAGRGGSMNFVLDTPVNPGQCVTIDYSIGFHTDFGPNQLWHNSATLDEYWSLPAQSGQKYAPTGSSRFYMTNQMSVQPLSKTLISPSEATIGEELVYRITVPDVAVSGALDNVLVRDTLHAALEYVSATATLNDAPLTITTIQSGQDLSWDLTFIPAGQQAVITLTTRVANNEQANAGTHFANTASYTYTDLPEGAETDGSSAPLTIVEPLVSITKSVNPETPPQGGDILTYTVTLSAAAGVEFSSAFDASLVDTPSLGMAYIAGTARVGGAVVEPVVVGDGVGTAQILTWADIDILEGTTVTISYGVQVLDSVVAGQTLTNSVTARWTSLVGDSLFERTGIDGSGGLNDYEATAASPPLTVPIPTLTVQKIATKLLGTTELPGTTANPGDRLRYTITIQNPTGIRVADFILVDETERLNATPMFQPNTIGNVTPAEVNADISSGTLSINNLNIGPNETLTIEFETVLRTDLKSGTVVLNQAELLGPWSAPILSDDPDAPGVADPTQTVIPANGVVYAAESRAPLAGVTLTMRLAATGSDLPANCFIDPSQQNQVTAANGEYKFDLTFDAAACPEGADYLIAVTAAPAGYLAEPSLIILPTSSDRTAPYSVPSCPADAIPATAQCEAHVSSTAPTEALTTYYLHLTLDSTANQIYNNHIPVDPKIEEKIYITKTSPLVNVTRGQIVPYTITFKNTLRSILPALGIVDLLPPGFKYVEGSSRYNDVPLEPAINGRELRWDNLDLGYNKPHTIKLLLVVGAGVSEGEYVNRAHVRNDNTGEYFSEVATATVRVIPDPTFDCTDVVGKVFDDRNLNGRQDAGEAGLPGVRVVTARGLIATTDEHGRFHITCAVVPDELRGSNFILKLDDRSLPTGYRLTTENPLVQRATRGKMLRYNFGATIHRIVAIDIADGAFEPGTTHLRLQWQPRLSQLLDELQKGPAVLRLSYLADVEPESIVRQRLESLKKELGIRWTAVSGEYRLNIETEVFWRRGGPP